MFSIQLMESIFQILTAGKATLKWLNQVAMISLQQALLIRCKLVVWIINLLLYIGQHDHLPQKQVLWRKMNILWYFWPHRQPRPHSAVICKTLLIGPGETALNTTFPFSRMSPKHITHMMPLWLSKGYYNYKMWPVNQTQRFRRNPKQIRKLCHVSFMGIFTLSSMHSLFNTQGWFLGFIQGTPA